MDKAVIIGAGRIAYSLVNALINSGIEIVQIISRNLESARSLAEKFDLNNFTSDLNKISTEANLIFICVNDSEIKNAAGKISLIEYPFNNKLFIHLSGAENIEVLNSLKDKGGLTASMHIMQSFPSKEIVEIKNCYTAIETESEIAGKKLFAIAELLNLRSFKINSESKSLYHLAGVFAVNFLNGNLFIANQLLQNAQVNIDVFELMKPIIETCLKNISQKGIEKSLSGPIDRGDILTIKKHLKSLDNIDDKSIKESYILQSLNLVHVAGKKYSELSENQIEIKNILKNKKP